MWKRSVPPEGLVVDGYDVAELGSVALTCR